MAFETIEGIIDEPTVNFVGKDGFFWWVGEVEKTNDPSKIGRVKCRVLGYYTNVRGGTTADLPTDSLPWATVLQPTNQPGNDGQGFSSNMLQPGAIVMGFFMDGENAQMPVVIGVMRVQKKDPKDNKTKDFVLTGEKMNKYQGINRTTQIPGAVNEILACHKDEGFKYQSKNNSVVTPGDDDADAGGMGSTKNAKKQEKLGAVDNDKGNAAANGVGGPWKTLEYNLNYLFEDLADEASELVKAEDGDYLNIVTGKLVTAKRLTAKIQNFLGAVFAQVVSAMRQALSNLADSLSLATLLGGATGAPYVTWGIIQTAVTTILKALCSIDSQIINFINDPVGLITGILESFLEGLIDKAAMVLQGVQKTINNVICNVQVILNAVSGIVSRVTTIVATVGKAKQILDTWKAGTKIFDEGFDLMKNGITSLTGLLKIFLKFIGAGCDRKAKGGESPVAWFPLFGVTNCSDSELDHIRKLKGKSNRLCGDGNPEPSGSLLGSIFEKADPFLTAAHTFIDGSWNLHIGTPGRTAMQQRLASGTMFTSVQINNYSYAQYLAVKQLMEEAEKEGKVWNEEEEKEHIEAAIKQNNSSNPPNKGDKGNLVADHAEYAGTHTELVKGDRCTQIQQDSVLNVDGDYRLKITGDCHIEVGGGFFLNATGAPKSVDKNGDKKDTGIQKHTLTFGSDVEMMTTGAKFELQAAEIGLAGTSTIISGSMFENSCKQQTRSAVEQIFSADNSIEMITTNLYQQINTPRNPLAMKSGITTICAGSVDTVLIPGGSATDAIPRYTITNPSGPYSCVSGLTGHTVTTTLFTVTAAGAATMTAGKAMTLASGAACTITATAAIKLLAATIHLN
tara:strand:- start:2028 stop:4577 length:2550 start_codon:yes stop_codon:yes gene_type:complete